MTAFVYRNGRLHAEGVSLAEVAERYGTPCYVYSRRAIEANWRAYDEALAPQPHLICYAVKANSNIAVIDILSRLGSGFDIVSVGELERVLAAGGDPARVVFAGVAKREDEMRRALEVGIRCFNVESLTELARLNDVAGELGVRAPVSMRVNPDVDAKTHPYISTGLKQNKFGIAWGDAPAVYREAAAMPHIDVIGVGCHIGSQLTSLGPVVDAVGKLLSLARQLASAGIAIRQLDIGGGLGIRYRDETPPSPAEYAAAVLPLIAGSSYELLIEPGRSIVGDAGVLLTRIEYLKETDVKSFAVVDAAMNDLLRPALYDAWQAILPVVQRVDAVAGTYDVVGPVCETADFLGKDRRLAVQAGDLLAVAGAGAYGFVMSSTYNSRPRAAELLVDGDDVWVIRRRETLEDLMAGESRLPAS